MGKLLFHVLETSALVAVTTAGTLPAVLGSEPLSDDAIEIVKRQTTGGTLPYGWFDRGCYTWQYDRGEYYPQDTYNAPMSAEFCVEFCRTNLPPPAPYTPPTKRELEARSYNGPTLYAATIGASQCST